MISRLLILVFLVTPVRASAPDHRVQAYSTDFKLGMAQELIVDEALREFKIYRPGWTWAIIQASRWDELQRHYKVTTPTAFTVWEEQRTYVNAALTEVKHQRSLRFTLAHELGHILCDIRDEDAANRAALQLQNGAQSSGDVCKADRR